MRSAWLLVVPCAAVLGFGAFGALDRRDTAAMPPPPATPGVMHGFVGVAGATEADVATMWVAAADAPPSIHYAPAEDLEHLDVAALDGATRTIDMAAFALTDRAVIEALARAAKRGVVVRLVVDRGQLEDRPETAPLIALQDLPGVALRVKRGYVYMHLKAYAVDGRLLRTGSANFSAAGLREQDNDLVFIAGPAAAAAFEADFAAMFAAGAKE